MKRHVPVLRRRSAFLVHVNRTYSYRVMARDPEDAIDRYMDLEDPDVAEAHQETHDMRAEPDDEK